MRGNAESTSRNDAFGQKVRGTVVVICLLAGLLAVPAAASAQPAGPTFEVEKDGPTSVPEGTSPASYTLVVRNPTATSLTLGSLVDDQFGDLLDSGNPALSANTCDDNPPTILGPDDGTDGSGGDEYSCAFTGTITANAGDRTPTPPPRTAMWSTSTSCSPRRTRC